MSKLPSWNGLCPLIAIDIDHREAFPQLKVCPQGCGAINPKFMTSTLAALPLVDLTASPPEKQVALPVHNLAEKQRQTHLRRVNKTNVNYAVAQTKPSASAPAHSTRVTQNTRHGPGPTKFRVNVQLIEELYQYETAEDREDDNRTRWDGKGIGKTFSHCDYCLCLICCLGNCHTQTLRYHARSKDQGQNNCS